MLIGLGSARATSEDDRLNLKDISQFVKSLCPLMDLGANGHMLSLRIAIQDMV